MVVRNINLDKVGKVVATHDMLVTCDRRNITQFGWNDAFQKTSTCAKIACGHGIRIKSLP